MTAQPRDLAAEVERIVATAEQHGDNTIYSLDDIKVLLLHIAALSRELEQLREKVRARPDLEAIDMDLSRAELAERELTALRRPVVNSEEIERIRDRVNQGLLITAHCEGQVLLSYLDGAHDHVLQKMQRLEIIYGQRIERLEGALQKSRPIPVTERLPTHIYSVFIFVLDDLHDDHWDSGIYNAHRGKWQCNDGEDDREVDVSHWIDQPDDPRKALAAVDGRQQAQLVRDAGKVFKGAASILAAVDQPSVTGDVVARPIPGIDQGQFLTACEAGNQVFGERNSGGTPE